jgi:hypothetical protein
MRGYRSHRAARVITLCCAVVVTLGGGASSALAACAPASTAKYPTAVKATSGLVGYWRLNETSGTQACDAHGANHGTFSGNVLLNQSGALMDLDPSTAFDGSTTGVRVPNAFALNPLSVTVEAWVHTTDIQRETQMIARKDGQYLFRVTGSPGYQNGNLNFRIYRADGYYEEVQYGMFVGGNRWAHVAATFDGSVMRIYADGREVAVRAFASALPSTTSDLYLGRRSSTTSPDHFAGRLDEIALYSRALYATEIKNHWEQSGPQTAISSAPDPFTNSGSAGFSFSSADAATTSFECKLDSGVWAACVSPNAYTNLVDGRHTFSVRAKTAAGYVDVTPATHTWKVERLGLESSQTLRGDGAELKWIQHHGTGFTSYEVHRGDSTTFVPSSTTLVAKITTQWTRTYRDTTAAASRTYTYKLLVNGVAQGTRTVTLPPAGEVIKTLQPGPDDGKGTYGYDAWDCANHGASNHLAIGRFTNNGAVQRALLGFDLSEIPTTATLFSANLDLRNIYSPGTTVTAQIHRVASAWEEGDEKGECAGPGASWKYASAGVPWTTLGGDFDPQIAAGKTQTAGQAIGTDTYDIKSLVGQWVAGTVPNHGMLFKLSDETPGTNKYVHYRSDDYTTDITHRPKLTVRYSTTDTTAPTIIPSGDLWDNRASVIDRYAQLNVRATDAGAGVKRIQVYVNGYLQEDAAERMTPCAGCDLTLNWTLDLGDVDLQDANGIEIRATDMNGNVAQVGWPMLLAAPEDIHPGTSASVVDADSMTPVGTQADGCDHPENAIEGEEQCPTVPEDNTEPEVQTRALSSALVPGGPGWGVADEKPVAWTEPLTHQLKPRIVRKIVFWDIFKRAEQTDPKATYNCRKRNVTDVPPAPGDLTELNDWMRDVKAMSAALNQPVEIFISFSKSRWAGARCYLPTTKQYTAVVSKFKQLYPHVKYYSAWNEPNLATQPTSWAQNKQPYDGRLTGPAQAGRYWVALNSLCQPPACLPAAAEFTDGDPYLFKKSRTRASFWTEYLKGHGTKRPKYWAFHPYWTGHEAGHNPPPRNAADNERVYKRLHGFITRARGRNSTAEIWFTEQGARWHLLAPNFAPRTDFGTATDPQADATANNIMTALTGEIASYNSRIKMFLAYQMVSHAGEKWDSGLLRATSSGWQPRTMWHTYKAKASP